MTASVVRVPGVDLGLSSLALGANHLGSVLDRDASFGLLDQFVACGGTTIDTALVYADWLPGVERSCSERTIGRWIASRGTSSDVVVTTKGGHPALTALGTPRLDPANLRHDVERSLDHLGLDRLPLWWLHRDDPGTGVDEIVDAVEDLCREGLVGSWGVANWRADRVQAALEHARRTGSTAPAASSVGFALAAPAPGVLADDLVTLGPRLAALHTTTGLPLVAYSAQAKGWFDKVAAGRSDELRATYGHGDALAVAAEVAELAGRTGLTPTETALAAVWLLPFPTVAVVGPRDPAQLDSCWRAAEVALDGETGEALRALLERAVLSGDLS